MATLTATRAAANFRLAGHGMASNRKTAWGSYALAANPTAADILQMCRVPQYATVLGGYLYATDIDTGTGVLDFDLGWAANGVDAGVPDGFGNFGALNGTAVANVIPAGGIWLPFQGTLMTNGPKTFAAETIIQIVFNTPANVFTAGRITVVADYHLE